MNLTKIKQLIEANQLRAKEAGAAASSADTAPQKLDTKSKGKDTTPDNNASNPNKELPPVTGKKTMTGQQPNEVDVEPGVYPPEIKEGYSAVVAFGRFNPPTAAHEQLIGLVEHFAKEANGEPMVFLSRSHDAKKNPMMYESKLAYARYAFGDIIRETPDRASDLINLATVLCSEGYRNLIFVAGEDRVAEYERKLNKYNGDLYEFDNIIVQSAGDRDPDSEGIRGVSATALRESAHEGDFAAFKAMLAPSLRYFAEEIYAEVRGELNELNTQQRMKRAIIFRRNKARIKVGRERALRRRAPSAALQKRARRLAIKMMRKRILRGKKYNDLSYAQRSMVDQRLKKRKSSIGKIARRLLPKVAKAEANRRLGGRFTDALQGKTVATEEVLSEMLNMVPETEYDYELSHKEVAALQEKAEAHDTSYDILETVFRRGVAMWENIETDMTFNQYGFARVNSFLNGGKAYDADFDMVVEDCMNHAYKDEEPQKDVRISVVRPSVVHKSGAPPSSPKKQELLKKIYEQLNESYTDKTVVTVKDLPAHYYDREFRDRQNDEFHGEAQEVGRSRGKVHLRGTIGMFHNMRNMAYHDGSKTARADRLSTSNARVRASADKTHAHLTAFLEKHHGRKLKLHEDLEVPNIEDGAGKRRCDMPQLTNFDAFHKDLTDAGHSLSHDYVKPGTLTPTQKHFNQEKVDKLKENGWGDKGIIISSDDYVIDGHHRWLAAHQKGEKIKARRTSLKRDELLDFCKGKPYVEKKNLNEGEDA